MTKIYTKTGDLGKTKNVVGKNLPKSDIQLEVVGSLDELNSSLGLLHLSKKKKLIDIVVNIQSDLFKIGAFFSGIPFKDEDKKWLEKRVVFFENLIDEIDEKNKPLKNFILPGGSFESSYLHNARSICRRVERVLVKYFGIRKSIKPLSAVLPYLNRLSDLLFVLARFYNKKGSKDYIWRP